MFQQLTTKELKFQIISLFLLFKSIQLFFGDFRLISIASATDLAELKRNISYYTYREEVHLKRQNTVREFCKNYNYNGDKLYNLTNQQMEHLLVDEEHKLLICCIPQVTCARKEFANYSLKSSNVSSKIQTSYNFVSLSEISNIEVRKVFDEYTRIVFVRHPFERLATAYRALLEKVPKNNETAYYQQSIGTTIAMNLRGENATAHALQYGDDVKFNELIEFLAKPELSKWFYQNTAFDHHFEPIAALCNPCTMDFNIIGKYETLSADLDFTVKKINKTLEFLTFEATEGNTQTNSYIQTLTDEQIRQILEIYRDDFHLFGYEIKI